MGYSLDAVLARRSDAASWKIPSTAAFPLTGELSLLPVTEDLDAVIGPIPRWAPGASRGTRVAHLTAEFFGGQGGHDCTLWIDGREAGTHLDINDVLARFGVKADGFHDAFDAVGLGRFRATESWAAQAVLHSLDVDGLIEALRYACRDRYVQGETRSMAASALGKLQATQAIPALGKALREASEYGVRLSAASALGMLGAPAVSVLIDALACEDPWGIVFAIGKIGPAARSAAPHLVPLLRHADWKIRLEAIQTLQAIEAPLKDLEPLIDDPEKLVRDAARKALSG